MFPFDVSKLLKFIDGFLDIVEKAERLNIRLNRQYGFGLALVACFSAAVIASGISVMFAVILASNGLHRVPLDVYTNLWDGETGFACAAAMFAFLGNKFKTQKHRSSL